MKRLQIILDHMAEWEKDIFQKEYADLNWYKGKQSKHLKEMERGQQKSQLGSYFSSPYYERPITSS